MTYSSVNNMLKFCPVITVHFNFMVFKLHNSAEFVCLAKTNIKLDVKVPSTGKRRMLITYTETPSSIPSPNVKGNVAMARFLCCFLLTLFL